MLKSLSSTLVTGGSGAVSGAGETAHTVFPGFRLCKASEGKLDVLPSKIHPLRDSALLSSPCSLCSKVYSQNHTQIWV